MPGDHPRSPPRSVPGLQESRQAPPARRHSHVRPCMLPSRARSPDPSICIRDAKEAFSVRPRFPDHFRYMTLDVQDNEDQNLIRLFPPCASPPPVSPTDLTHLPFPAQRRSSTRRSQAAAACSSTATVCPPSHLCRVRLRSSRSSCSGGISLSPSFVVMFVMEHHQMPWEDALQYVQNRRYCISPNGGFLTQIKVASRFSSCASVRVSFLLPIHSLSTLPLTRAPFVRTGI